MDIHSVETWAKERNHDNHGSILAPNVRTKRQTRVQMLLFIFHDSQLMVFSSEASMTIFVTTYAMLDFRILRSFARQTHAETSTPPN